MFFKAKHLLKISLRAMSAVLGLIPLTIYAGSGGDKPVDIDNGIALSSGALAVINNPATLASYDLMQIDAIYAPSILGSSSNAAFISFQDSLTQKLKIGFLGSLNLGSSQQMSFGSAAAIGYDFDGVQIGVNYNYNVSGSSSVKYGFRMERSGGIILSGLLGGFTLDNFLFGVGYKKGLILLGLDLVRTGSTSFYLSGSVSLFQENNYQIQFGVSQNLSFYNQFYLDRYLSYRAGVAYWLGTNFSIALWYQHFGQPLMVDFKFTFK